MRSIITLSAACLLAIGSTAALADEQPVDLKAAPGKEVVENNCASCHSLDYIKMNSPFMTGKVWESEVTKMIKSYHAPIEETDAKVIIEYLTKNYGG